MIEKIYEVLKKYNDANKMADAEFYNEIYCVFKNELNNDDYLNKLVVISPKEHMDPKFEQYTEGFAGMFGQAAYRHESKEMIIFMRNLNYFTTMAIENLCVDEKDVIPTFNLLIMQTLLHELEHVKQEKKLKEGTDIESELLRVTYSSEEETDTSYDYSLQERLAELRGYEQVIKIYELLELDIPLLYQYLEEKIKNVYLSGYHFIDENGRKTEEETENFVSSTDYYVSLRNCDKDRYFEIANKIQEDRFLYGLSISVEEYKQYKKENIKLSF